MVRYRVFGRYTFLLHLLLLAVLAILVLQQTGRWLETREAGSTLAAVGLVGLFYGLRRRRGPRWWSSICLAVIVLGVLEQFDPFPPLVRRAVLFAATAHIATVYGACHLSVPGSRRSSRPGRTGSASAAARGIAGTWWRP